MEFQNKRLLRRYEAATFLSDRGYPIRPQTLSRAAVEGWGPNFVIWGRWPLYHPDDLIIWAQHRAGHPMTNTATHGSRKGKRSSR